MLEREEVLKIISILLKADNECSVCTKDLIKEFCREFSVWSELAKEKYHERFENEKEF